MLIWWLQKRMSLMNGLGFCATLSNSIGRLFLTTYRKKNAFILSLVHLFLVLSHSRYVCVCVFMCVYVENIASFFPIEIAASKLCHRPSNSISHQTSIGQTFWSVAAINWNHFKTPDSIANSINHQQTQKKKTTRFSNNNTLFELIAKYKFVFN